MAVGQFVAVGIGLEGLPHGPVNGDVARCRRIEWVCSMVVPPQPWGACSVCKPTVLLLHVTYDPQRHGHQEAPFPLGLTCSASASLHAHLSASRAATSSATDSSCIADRDISPD